jgi:hypothetical protein
MQWRTIDGVTLDPLGQFNELETLIRGVLAPAMLLDYLRFFVLFETTAAGQEGRRLSPVPCVRAAITQVVAASRPSGKRHKGGVVWHTQGSGKSITMTCFAARVMQEAAMENPTIVVITDRNDLDGQLFGVFSLAQDLLREQPVQADTRQDLRAKLATGHPAASSSPPSRSSCRARMKTVFPVLSERHNIVVIADEAHRTQYGFEAKLKIGRNFRSTAANGQQAANDSQVLQGRATGCLRNPLSGRLRPASARCAAQRHFRGLHRHAGIERRPRYPRRVRRLHPRLRHAAGQGRRRDGGHLLRVAPGQAVAEAGNCRRSTTRSMNWPRTRKKPARPS